MISNRRLRGPSARKCPRNVCGRHKRNAHVIADYLKLTRTISHDIAKINDTQRHSCLRLYAHIEPQVVADASRFVIGVVAVAMIDDAIGLIGTHGIDLVTF